MKDFEEMRRVIEKHCENFVSDDPFGDNLCMGCPLDDNFETSCYSDATPEELERNYDKLMLSKYQSIDVRKIMEEKEDIINHPNHYTNGGMECIDEMLLIFGKRVVADFCLCNVWKYRYRSVTKNGDEDIQKSHWYMNKYKELVEDMEDDEYEFYTKLP